MTKKSQTEKASMSATHIMGGLGVRGADVGSFTPQSIANEETRIFVGESVSSHTDQMIMAGDDLAMRFRGLEDGSGLNAQMYKWHQSITSSEQTPRYDMQDLLGLGAQGLVFSVSDNDCGRKVALKTMRGSNKTPAQIARFVHEAQVTAQLEHPGVVPVYELNVLPDGTLFYTMKRIGGRSLADELRVKRDDANRRFHFLQIFLKICDTMSFAHSRGVVHRDLKPANIMVGEYGEVMVLDWGLSKVLGQADVVSLRSRNAQEESDSGIYVTRDGQAVGTPAYMSPEQANGHRDSLDARSDVYSLGVILYEMLAKNLPYTGVDVASVMEQVGNGIWVPLNKQVYARNENHQLIAIVHKAMACVPDDRYDSVDDLLSDVRANMADEAISAYADTLPDRLLRYIRRHKSQLKTATSLILLFVVLGTITFAYNDYQQQQKIHRLKLSAFHSVTQGDFKAALKLFDKISDQDEMSIFARDGKDAAIRQLDFIEKEAIESDLKQRRHEKRIERQNRFDISMISLSENIDLGNWTEALTDYKVALKYSPEGDAVATVVMLELRKKLDTGKHIEDAARDYDRKMQRVENLVKRAIRAEGSGYLEDAKSQIETAIRYVPESNESRRKELEIFAKRLSLDIVGAQLQRALDTEKKQRERQQRKNVTLAKSQIEKVAQLMPEYNAMYDSMIQLKNRHRKMDNALREGVATISAQLALEEEILALEQRQISVNDEIQDSLGIAQVLAPELPEIKEAWATYYVSEILFADARGDTVAAQIAATRGAKQGVENAAYDRIFSGFAILVNESSLDILEVYAVAYDDKGALILKDRILSIAAGEQENVPFGHYVLRFAGLNHSALVLQRGQIVHCSDSGRRRFDLLQSQIAKNTNVANNPVFDLAFVAGGSVYVSDGMQDASARAHAHADFAMCRYELSFADYVQFLNDPHRPLAERKRDEPLIGIDNRLLKRDSKGVFHLEYRQKKSAPALRARTPVYGITYIMIERYIEWLRKRTGLAWRLPTEKEWQLAAQAGDQRRFPWGDKPDYRSLCYSARAHDARYSRISQDSGSFPSDCTVNGIHDLAGSLSEIVYSAGSVNQPVVICGGSYADRSDEHFETTYVRKIAGKNTIDSRVGFRLVISLGEK